MRTKKLLSVLLAVLLAVGVGAVSASAIDDDAFVADEAEVLVFAEQEEAEAVAVMAAVAEPEEEIFTVQDDDVAAAVQYASGRPQGVEIYPDSTLLKRWDCATICWDVFGRSVAVSPFDGYYDLKTSVVAGSSASVDWKVFVYLKDINGVINRTELIVYANETLASTAPQNLKVYRGSTGTQERLYIQQNKGNYLGQVDIEMTLKASFNGWNPTTYQGSDSVSVNLRTQKDVEDLLADAKKITDKSDRYRKDYIDELKDAVTWAQNLFAMNPKDPSFEDTIEVTKKHLKDTIALAKVNYKLSGWEFLDNLLPQGLIGFIWMAIDFFNAINVIWEPIGKMFSAIFKLFGFIVPFFQAILKLFGL